jgi:hypothetical protein
VNFSEPADVSLKLEDQTVRSVLSARTNFAIRSHGRRRRFVVSKSMRRTRLVHRIAHRPTCGAHAMGVSTASASRLSTCFTSIGSTLKFRLKKPSAQWPNWFRLVKYVHWVYPKPVWNVASSCQGASNRSAPERVLAWRLSNTDFNAFLSDIVGVDISAHGNGVPNVVKVVCNRR